MSLRGQGNHGRGHRRGGQDARRGMVLIIVVVVVAMLSLAGLSFVITMSTEYKAARAQGDQLQLEHVAGSAVECIKAFCDQPWQARQNAGGTWDNAEVFRGVLVLNDEAQQRQARFSVVSPKIEDGAATGLRFGLENESARLNLAVLLQWEQSQPGSAQKALMSLPGMTESIAAAILDWIDADSEQRQLGSEADYYQGLGVPYSPRNGVPQCLEELLLVRGVTRELLFGKDTDFNHKVEGEEGRAATNSIGSGPARSLPWASLLTVSSAERNRSANGEPRINLNQDDLATLHSQLQGVLERRQADFVVLFRQYGPAQTVATATQENTATLNLSVPAKIKIETVLDLIDAKVELPDPTRKQPRVVASPFTSDRGTMRDYLPKLLDRATVVDQPVLYGLVNVNLASRDVLKAVPGMDSASVEQIVAARGSSRTQEGNERRHPTWPLVEGMVDLARMKAVLPYLTCGGDVFRAQVVAFYSPSGPSMRGETVIDATVAPTRQVYWKDLRLFGKGYPLESLGAEGTDGTTMNLPRR